ncbi:MAG: thiol peroxidase [Muribaculaceae bacterium]|nr:thiol peroxidase [Muribaculaceae bacterium]
MNNTIYLNGMPMHISDALPKPGAEAPNFALTARDLTDVALHDYKGRRIVLNVFPSIDTEVCATSVRKFNMEASKYDNTVVLCVSMDLPFAAARFCAANDIENVIAASAFRSDFGRNYGLEILDGPMRGLLARAVVVIDENGKIAGTSLCEQITEEPDYEFVHKLLKK